MKGRETVVREQFSVPARQRTVDAGVLPVAGRPLPGGFTLIEMLVALAIAGTIATIVYGSYAAATRSLDTYGCRLACCDRTSLVLRLLARQIRCAWAPPAAAGITAQQNTLSSASNGIAETTRTSAAFHTGSHTAGGTILSFLSTGGFDAGPGPSTALSRITYYYDPAQGVLAMGCEPYRNGPEAEADAGVSQPVLRGVRRLEMYFQDGRQWRSEWQGAEGLILPRAVRIEMTVVDERERRHEFRMTVPLGCRSALSRQRLIPEAELL